MKPVSSPPYSMPIAEAGGSITASWASWMRDLFEVVRPSVTTVANLPTATTLPRGLRSMVSDATVTTFASVVVGGGANLVPVYSDGTNWRIG